MEHFKNNNQMKPILLNSYIVDFYAFEIKLAIKLDGMHHY